MIGWCTLQYLSNQSTGKGTTESREIFSGEAYPKIEAVAQSFVPRHASAKLNPHKRYLFPNTSQSFPHPTLIPLFLVFFNTKQQYGSCISPWRPYKVGQSGACHSRPRSRSAARLRSFGPWNGDRIADIPRPTKISTTSLSTRNGRIAPKIPTDSNWNHGDSSTSIATTPIGHYAKKGIEAHPEWATWQMAGKPSCPRPSRAWTDCQEPNSTSTRNPYCENGRLQGVPGQACEWHCTDWRREVADTEVAEASTHRPSTSPRPRRYTPASNYPETKRRNTSARAVSASSKEFTTHTTIGPLV